MRNTGEDRPDGVHLSDILTRMAWEKDKKYHPEAPKDLMQFEQGHTWERVLEQALSARHERPGHRPDPIQHEGIWCSPDWINGDGLLEEWKCTRKSSKSFEQKLDEWGPQVMAYLHVLLTKKIIKKPIVRIRTWFLVGDWSFEAKGDLTLLRDYYKFDIEFDKRDLENKWREIVQAGRKFGLLKTLSEEPTWRRPQLEATLLRRKAAGKVPRPSSKAAIVTFPPTRRLSPRRSGS